MLKNPWNKATDKVETPEEKKEEKVVEEKVVKNDVKKWVPQPKIVKVLFTKYVSPYNKWDIGYIDYTAAKKDLSSRCIIIDELNDKEIQKIRDKAFGTIAEQKKAEEICKEDLEKTETMRILSWMNVSFDANSDLKDLNKLLKKEKQKKK